MTDEGSCRNCGKPTELSWCSHACRKAEAERTIEAFDVDEAVRIFEIALDYLEAAPADVAGTVPERQVDDVVPEWSALNRLEDSLERPIIVAVLRAFAERRARLVAVRREAFVTGRPAWVTVSPGQEAFEEQAIAEWQVSEEFRQLGAR